MMKLFLMLVTFFSMNAFAVPECTKAPRESWLKPEQVKEKARLLGYKIKKFTTMEYCFKIEGFDKAAKKIEIYFDPQTGGIVKPAEFVAPKD